MRYPVFNGSFYPKDKEGIVDFLSEAFEKAKLKGDYNPLGFVSPHAGYIYSGYTAAYTYKAMKFSSAFKDADTIVIIGPNHTGIGTPTSVSIEDWSTPLGIAHNDKELSEEIAKSSDHIYIDESAHADEHSVEVQIPFIQFISGNNQKRFVFICMGDQSLDQSERLSNAIYNSADKLNRKLVILASSDFNHYESEDLGKSKDLKLISSLEKLDYEGFSQSVEKLDDSICGFGPITTTLLYSKMKGAKKGILLNFSNSGKGTGDYDKVVDYASIIFE